MKTAFADALSAIIHAELSQGGADAEEIAAALEVALGFWPARHNRFQALVDALIIGFADRGLSSPALSEEILAALRDLSHSPDLAGAGPDGATRP